MTTYIALLRAVNVGGTGKLPMKRLEALCTELGFAAVRTYIQSGNVVLESRKREAGVTSALEEALSQELGKPTRVLLRIAAELRQVAAKNPFPEAAPNRVMCLFLREPPPRGALAGWPIPGSEELHLSGRELYIHYPDGMGQSKLKLPFADLGTARNLNTVNKLVELAG